MLNNVEPEKEHKLTILDNRKGGSVSSPEKRYAKIITQSSKAKCKNCKALCFLKNENIKIEPECICPIPKVRAYSIFYQMPVMDENVIIKLEQETITKMIGVCNKPTELKMLHDVLNTKKNTDYPKVNRNLNVNLNTDKIEIKINIPKEVQDLMKNGN